MRVLPMKVPKLTYYNNLWSFSCGHDLRYVSYSSNVGATKNYKHLKICYNPVKDKSLFFSSAWKRKKRIEDWAKFYVIMHMIILDLQDIIK